MDRLNKIQLIATLGVLGGATIGLWGGYKIGNKVGQAQASLDDVVAVRIEKSYFSSGSLTSDKSFKVYAQTRNGDVYPCVDSFMQTDAVCSSDSFPGVGAVGLNAYDNNDDVVLYFKTDKLNKREQH